MALGILDKPEALRVIRVDILLDQALEGPLVVVPLVDVGAGLELSSLGSTGSSVARRLGRRLAAAGLVLAGLVGVVLSLTSSGGGAVSRRGRGRRLDRSAIVVVNPPHVVSQVPLARESMSRKRALTSLIGAQVRLLPMAVHGVGLALMAEQAGSRREPGVLAALNLAAVWLQVGIHEFATEGRGG